MSLFTPTQWWSLPLALRQRFWRESDYGERMPSAPLMMEILVALARRKPE